mmetsp:Transcript_18719/g.28707  ORF Transcript_18719/g.28707 Transcript_18719/m.28707 type:complete len:86 (+) Transcript_18719:458-715(+)
MLKNDARLGASFLPPYIKKANLGENPALEPSSAVIEQEQKNKFSSIGFIEYTEAFPGDIRSPCELEKNDSRNGEVVKKKIVLISK